MATIHKMTKLEERAYAYVFKKLDPDIAWYADLVEDMLEEYKEIASEQKAIDDAERKSLIEKVIWLIEDSYPETDLWTHSELVENVTRDLESRSDELKKMFDNS